VGEVENDFLFVGGDELADGVAEQAGFVAGVMRPLMSTMVTWLTSRVVRCMGIRLRLRVNGIGTAGLVNGVGS